jgi:hypothetical protein
MTNDSNASEADSTPQVVSHDDWLPWRQKPILWSDWQQLEQQALRTCQRTGETYRDSKRCNLPDWFMERVARNWYRAKRRYWRIKRGNESRLKRGLVNLLAQIGCG